jgi:DNA-directed RNA polymerases I, II, and III subunit RPABC2
VILYGKLKKIINNLFNSFIIIYIFLIKIELNIKVICYIIISMSDLELSDNESIGQVSDDEQDAPPTFTKKTAKISDDKLKVYDEEGNVMADYNEDDEEEEEEEEEDEDEDEEVDFDDEDMEDSEVTVAKKKIAKKSQGSNDISTLPDTQIELPSVFEKEDDDYNSDSDEEEDEEYLQKFDKEIRENYILSQHPESLINNYDEIYNLAKVQRNKENIIIDNLHKTIPILTKYEKTKILGLRAKQLNNGALPYVKLNSNIIDGYLIALKELEQKKIPFIIRRPLPSGASEYWHLQDLEIIQ